VKLFCLAHAGGSANVFLPWRAHLDRSLELVPVELPGRGRRIAEPLRSRFDDVLADVVPRVARHGLADDYAIFGHSFGAVIGYELAHVLVAGGERPPRVLFVSAQCSPERIAALDFGLADDDRTLLDSLAYLGGTPQEILADDEAVELFAPILRADLRALYDYRHVAKPKLPCEIGVLLGSDDEIAGIDDAVRWASLAEGRAWSRILAGGHFAALEQPAEVATWVSGLLTRPKADQQPANRDVSASGG
jgi:surfactin synthase thioesterase subunit